jgi:hypothetical protein
LLRTGDEVGARVALEAAWKADPFSKLTKNQLDVMDKVDKYVTLREGDVVMRLDPGEAPVLREYAMALAHQALSTLAARYEFTPRGPILVEIFRSTTTSRSARSGCPAWSAPWASVSVGSSSWTRPKRGLPASSSGKRRCGTSSRTSSRCRCPTSACRAG